MTGSFNLTSPNFPARDRMNDRMIVEAAYTGPASYVTGGDPYVAGSDLPMGEIYNVLGVISNGTNIRIAVWDYTNQKLMFWDPAAGTQAANGANLSGFTGTLLVTGKG